MHKNFCYRAPIENTVGKISNRLGWINWANQRRCRVNAINPVQSNAKEAIAARIEFSGAYVEDRWIRRRQCQRSNRHCLRVVKDGSPGAAAIERPPHAALRGSQVDLGGIGRIHRNRRDPAGHGYVGIVQGLSIGNRDRPDCGPCCIHSLRGRRSTIKYRLDQPSLLLTLHLFDGVSTSCWIEWPSRLYSASPRNILIAQAQISFAVNVPAHLAQVGVDTRVVFALTLAGRACLILANHVLGRLI